jgi:hypothetical protein
MHRIHPSFLLLSGQQVHERRHHVTENRDATIWRATVTEALKNAAGRKIDIVDAFRLRRFVDGKNRPVLVKLSSVWNRRPVMAGARKLCNVTELQCFTTADERFEARRRNTLDRLKYRAQREQQTNRYQFRTMVSCQSMALKRFAFNAALNFISSQSSANNDNRNGM